MDRDLLPCSVTAAPNWKVYRRNGLRMRSVRVCLTVGLLFFAVALAKTGVAAELADDIRLATVITGASGEINGDNLNATLQSSEPRHAGKVGGHSVWFAWQAPTNGLATFNVSGTGFEAVVAAYAYEHDIEGGSSSPPDPSKPFDGLEALTRTYSVPTNAPVSSIRFGVVGGVIYRIAVDGLNGASGALAIDWSFAESGSVPPVITGPSADQALREGDTLTLSFQIQSAERPEYRWFRDGEPVDDADRPTLTISNLRRNQVGKYQLRVSTDDFVFYTGPVEIQINSEGDSESLARDRADEALLSGLPQWHGLILRQSINANAASPVGVVRGYNGSQIFNTVTARRDPGEPNHCGVAGGASYWWAYQPPEDGRVSLDTIGSSFNTVLAVYTFDLPFTGYQSLISVACDVGSPGNGGSAVQFRASAGRTYLVVVDGVDGARGLVTLNYKLDDLAALTTPPRIDVQPQAQSTEEGGTVIFQVSASGDGVLSYQWLFDSQPMEGQTNASLILTNLALSQAGVYTVQVHNDAGGTLSALAELVVVPKIIAPSVSVQPTPQIVAPGGLATFRVTALGTEPIKYQWRHDGQPMAGKESSDLPLNNVMSADEGLYDVIVSNAGGTVISESAQLTVQRPPQPPMIVRAPESITIAIGQSAFFTATAEGDAPLFWQWFRNGAPIDGAVGSEFRIESVTAGDAGFYSVQVINTAGSTQSLPVELRVLVPPAVRVSAVGRALAVSVSSVSSLSYVLETADPSDLSHWSTVETLAGTGGEIVFQEIPLSKQAGLFRVHVE